MSNAKEQFFEKIGHKEILCAYSFVRCGDMKNCSKNRLDFLQKVAPRFCQHKKLIISQNIHGGQVEIVDKNSPSVVLGAYGLITDDEEIVIGSTFADCLIGYFFDPANRIIGIGHAGYKGIQAGLFVNLVEKMIDSGSDPEDIRVFIGPSICQEHYEFGPEAPEVFRSFSQYICRIPGSKKYKANLRFMARDQIVHQGGVPEENVEISQICTFEDKDFFSFRRDKTNPVKAGMGIIALR